MKRCVLLTLAVSLLVGCTGQAAPTPAVIATDVAQAEAGTLMAAVPAPTRTGTTTPTPLAVPKTSYDASNTSLCLPEYRPLAIGYADFNRDGREDLLTAPISGTRDRSAASLRLQTPSGRFVKDNSLFQPAVPGTVHARKIVIADFNRDSYPDAFIADHGFDQPPFPGAASILLLSQDGTLGVVPIANMPTGFQHAATAADLTGDGAPDILVMDSTNGAFLLRNDGAGHFTVTRRGIPAIRNGYYTSELIDLDADGSYDLMVGGHEQDGAETLVFWGDPRGAFAADRVSGIPADPDYRIVLDFDVADLDGDGRREWVVTRTKAQPFYQGFYFQILDVDDGRVTDVSDRIVPDRSAWEGRAAGWVAWIVIRDFDGDGSLDLVAPDSGCHLVYLNDGQGNFRRAP